MKQRAESGPSLGPHPPPTRLRPGGGSSAATHTKDFCERNAPKSPDFRGFYF
jgi:hypothetical protein